MKTVTYTCDYKIKECELTGEPISGKCTNTIPERWAGNTYWDIDIGEKRMIRVAIGSNLLPIHLCKDHKKELLSRAMGLNPWYEGNHTPDIEAKVMPLIVEEPQDE